MNKKEFIKYKKRFMERKGEKIGPCNVISHHLERPIECEKRNANILGIGDYYSYMSSSIVAPNLMQMTGSYFVYDYDGLLLKTIGPVLQDFGYKVREFHLLDAEKSETYNPFTYFENEEDISIFAKTLVASDCSMVIRGEGFEEQTYYLLMACIYAVLEYNQEKNMDQVLKAVESLSSTDSNEMATKTMFAHIPEGTESKKYFRKFLNMETKEGREVCVEECKMLLQIFNKDKTPHVNGIDTLQLDSLGTERTAIFLVTDHYETNSGALPELMVQQAFKALNRHPKYHVTFVVKDFLRICRMPEIFSMLASAREYDSSFIITVQDLIEMQMMYGEKWDYMLDLCDVKVAFYDTDEFTNEYMAEYFEKLDVKVPKLKDLDFSKCIVVHEGRETEVLTDAKYDIRKHPLFYKIDKTPNIKKMAEKGERTLLRKCF